MNSHETYEMHDEDMRTTIHDNDDEYMRTKWYRVAKTRRMSYLYRSFSAKELYNQGLFCEN